MNTRTRIHCISLAVTAWLFLGGWAFAAPSTDTVVIIHATASSETVTLIRAEMLQRYFGETRAEKFFKERGPSAVPVLCAILREDISPRVKGKIAFYLGKSGDARGTKATIDLIERAKREPIGQDEEYMLEYAMLGLGFTREKKALALLEKASWEEFWEGTTGRSRSGKGADQAIENRKRHLRRRAAFAISLAGNQEALGILTKMKASASADSIEHAETCIHECQRRISGEHLKDRKKYRPMM